MEERERNGTELLLVRETLVISCQRNKNTATVVEVLRPKKKKKKDKFLEARGSVRRRRALLTPELTLNFPPHLIAVGLGLIFRLLPVKLFLHDCFNLQKQLSCINLPLFKRVIIATINRVTRLCQKLSAYHSVYSSP